MMLEIAAILALGAAASATGLALRANQLVRRLWRHVSGLDERQVRARVEEALADERTRIAAVRSECSDLLERADDRFQRARGQQAATQRAQQQRQTQQTNGPEWTPEQYRLHLESGGERDLEYEATLRG